jgi:hypothetical protein
MDYFAELYFNDEPIKSRVYFNMMVENKCYIGNIGIIRLGCNKEREIELLTEIVTKWETNMCNFRDMSDILKTLIEENVDSKLLLEHSERLGLKNDTLKIKIQSEEIILKNKLKYSKFDECPICLTEKDLIPFDCFGHFYCLECDKRINKCSLCRISRNRLI